MNFREINRKLLSAIESKLHKRAQLLNECTVDSKRPELKASVAECFNERGLFRYKTIEFAEAIDDYGKAIEYNDKFAAAYYNRGVVLYRMGFFQRAVVDFEKALLLDPNNIDFQLALKDTKEAIDEN